MTKEEEYLKIANANFDRKLRDKHTGLREEDWEGWIKIAVDWLKEQDRKK